MEHHPRCTVIQSRAATYLLTKLRWSHDGDRDRVNITLILLQTEGPGRGAVPDGGGSADAAAGGGGSRPGSSHSAPMLDLSIDRHYEFDAARTPTDDLGHISSENISLNSLKLAL